MITKFIDFLNESIKVKELVFHGSPYKFTEFKNRNTFFSETKKFASEYGSTKGMDYGIDNDIIIYTCKINCEIFDINDKNDFNKLKKALPNKLSYIYNNFGFSSSEIDKNTYLELMKGNDVEEPIEGINNLKIGDSFPNPEYKPEKYTVVDIDVDFVYAYFNNTLMYKLSDEKKLGNYSELFKGVYEFLEKYIKDKTNKKYIYKDDINDLYNSFYSKNFNYSDIEEPTELEYNEFNKLNNEFIGDCIKKCGVEKFIKKPMSVKLNDTWRFFENTIVDDLIHKLGYGGYVAKENGVNTYCVFNPKNDVEIIKIEE